MLTLSFLQSLLFSKFPLLIRDCQSLRLTEKAKQDKRNTWSLSKKINVHDLNSGTCLVLVLQGSTLPISIPAKRFACWHLHEEVAFAFGGCIWCRVFFAVTLFWWHVKVISAEQRTSVNFQRKDLGMKHPLNSKDVACLKIAGFFPHTFSQFIFFFFFFLWFLSVKPVGVKWCPQNYFCIVILQSFLKI